MSRKLLGLAAVGAAALLLSAPQTGNAGLRGGKCCAPAKKVTCHKPAPTCGARPTCGHRLRDHLSGLGGRLRGLRSTCCAPKPTCHRPPRRQRCCAPKPTCCAPKPACHGGYGGEAVEEAPAPPSDEAPAAPKKGEAPAPPKDA